MLVGPIGRYTTGLFWSRGLGHVPGSVWWRHRGVFRFCNMFHQEVYRRFGSDQNHPHLPQPKPWINSDVRSALSARTSAFKSGNTDDRKQASYDLRRSIKAAKRQCKTKLKNISTTTTQEACGRALTTSQALKGINQLLWTLPPLYRTSSTPFMLVSRLITPPTQRVLTWLLQKRWVHSRFLSRM